MKPLAVSEFRGNGRFEIRSRIGQGAIGIVYDAFDRERNYPLPNLFVSVLQRLGIPQESFASGTGTMRGLDMI